MTLRFLLFAEDQLHSRTVHDLTDAVLREKVSWLADHDDLSPFREWWVDEEARSFHTDFLKLSGGQRRFAEGRRPRAHGHFGRIPAEPDARLLRECLLFARREAAAAVFFARDDDEVGRAAGLGQAIERDRSENARRLPVVRALARPEMEAWAIVTWRPTNETDSQKLAVLRSALGFDVTRSPERLSARRESTSARNAKLVAAHLGATSVSLDIPHIRLVAEGTAGTTCGLGQFIRDLDQEVVPLVSGEPVEAQERTALPPDQ